jgi:hypothetical protein
MIDSSDQQVRCPLSQQSCEVNEINDLRRVHRTIMLHRSTPVPANPPYLKMGISQALSAHSSKNFTRMTGP